MNPVYIIAEAGVNHNGDERRAFQLVDVAAQAGADAIKFQTFRTENMVTKNAYKANYQLQATDIDETQFAMLKKLELPYDVHFGLTAYCEAKGLDFLSTAFDMESLDFLVDDIGLNTLKIPSGEITNGPFLLAHSQTQKNLILSTGMSTLDEIEEALAIVAFGLLSGTAPAARPSRPVFQQAYNSPQGQQLLQQKVTLLHCTTEYPAPPADINLSAMRTLHHAFGLKVGYSDHSEGISIAVAATALGARVIEKHLTVDKILPGPDHRTSLEPDEFGQMVDSIRTVEKAMGDGLKVPKPSETANRNIARKSLVAGNNIRKGDAFSEKNLAIKRPGTGRSPMDYWDLLGTESPRNYFPDEIIS